jgi:amino acid adenylation domain-containing protein
LAKIWSQVLRVERVGTEDNFFQLGGDSIRAAQVIARARAAMQSTFSIAAFFEKPTLGGLAESIDRIRSEAGLQGRPLRRAAKSEQLPLSFAQRSLWLFQQLEPENPAYNRPLAVRLTGPVQPQVLERCLNEIVRRHEVLRTRFLAADGEPMQAIFPPASSPLDVIDLGGLPHGERETEALRQAIDASQRPFDLARESLVRTRLFPLGERDHLLLFVTHHIVFDGWSERLLLEEILALYRAFFAGEAPSLPPLPIQYADYALWQQGQVDDPKFAEDLCYWKQRLEGAPQVLNLPADRPRPPVQTYRGARQTFSLPVLLSDRLRELSGREGCTLFMTLFAAFNVLLYRYTRQRDILVGVPVAGRNRIETEKLIGVFINILALRTQLSRDGTFRELLRQVREVALGAYSHQDMPFGRLVEALQPDRDLSRAPLFQVMFQFRNLPPGDVDVQGLEAQAVSLDIGASKFDLTLDIEDKKALACTLEYSTDLFDPATILRMQDHLRTLLEGIVVDPDQRLSDLPLLTEDERHRLLVEWNDTKSDYPGDKCVHQLFEDQVGRTPDAVAVIFEDKRITYRELDLRANQLARYLESLGVGPETRVGISVNAPLEMIVGLLGILKSGGAYVPLDPAYPRDRLAFMLEDAQIAVLISQRRLVDSLPPCKAKLVCLDSDREAIGRSNGESPRSKTDPENTAYVIYTSGSTGLPKAVAVLQKGLVNQILDASARYCLGRLDRRPQLTSLSFDVAAAEIFSTLASGAALVLRPGPWFDSYEDFLRFLEEGELTVVSLPTAYWHGWVAELSRSKSALPQTLRLVIVGTEQASAEHLDIWRNLAGGQASWCNAYGLTEATITSSVYGPVVGREGRRIDTIPIGRPIRNTQVYVLDDRLQLAPAGVPGELHIGGDGLARGYLNHSDLTAEKFIPNPFSVEPGSRLYKTNDVGRFLADGNIEFLGRIDDQVKIRGFRVEPGEIEVALGGHPAVRQAVVMAREDTPGDKRLTAYVVPELGQAPTISELRSFSQEKLPEYMVPSAFVFLGAMPLTPNGKVDRRSLPAPDLSRDGAATFVAHRTPIEEALVNIWREVLRLPTMGVQDNFFELGGHSLSAAQVVSRVNAFFQLALPLRVLFDKPTIERLAKVIVQNQLGAAREPEPGAISVEFESISEEEASRRLATEETKEK